MTEASIPSPDRHDLGVSRHLVSIGHLLSGNFANALLMLIGTMIAARSLGPASYGVFALVLTIGRFSERILRFESWQPLIKYYAEEEIAGDPERQAQLFLYGLLLDIVCALLAAALAVVGGLVLMPVLQLQAEHLPLVMIYAVAIAVNIRGLPTAALRLAGQFRTLAYVQMFSSIVRVALAGLALWQGAGLLEFVIIWTVAQALDSLIYLWLGLRAVRSMGAPSPLRAKLKGMTRNFPGFMGFAWSTNLSSALATMTQEADTLLVGALAGNSAAGVYHLVKRIAKVAQQVGGQVQAVLYPDMARLRARADFAGFKRLTLRIQLILGSFGLLVLAACWLLGAWAIGTVFGADYVAAYPLLVAQLVAVTLILHAAPTRSALLAMGKPTFILGTALAATGLFFMVAWFAIPRFGALGANLAHIAFAAWMALVLDLAFWRLGRSVAAAKPLAGNGREAGLGV